MPQKVNTFFCFFARFLLLAGALIVCPGGEAGQFCRRTVDQDPRDDWSYAFGKLSGYYEWVTNMDKLKKLPFFVTSFKSLALLLVLLPLPLPHCEL